MYFEQIDKIHFGYMYMIVFANMLLFWFLEKFNAVRLPLRKLLNSTEFTVKLRVVYVETA